jgi:hypothetical protein
VFFFANGELLRLSESELTSVRENLSANEPEIIGPDKLCIVFGSVIGDFFGAGDSATDVYYWKIYSPTNQLVFEDSGGARVQTISYTFSIIGVHRVELAVRRAGILIKEDQKNVELIRGPKPLLKLAYSVCSGQEIELVAIDPESPRFSEYIFNWTDDTGTTISTSNSLKTSTLGEYFVNFYFLNQDGNPECETQLSTTLSEITSFDIISSESSTCPNQQLTFTSNPLVVGNWSYEKSGGPRTLIRSASNITISSDELDGPGDYKIFLTLSNSNNPQCIQEKSIDLAFTPRPEFEILGTSPSSGCLNPDGAIQIRAITQIDQLFVGGTSVSTQTLAPGDIVELLGFKSGTYTVFGTLGSCMNNLATVVPLDDPPLQLEFEVTDIQPEICTETGKQNGSFTIAIVNGSLTGSYKVTNERGGVIRSAPILNQSEIVIEIPGGLYFFELFDEDLCSLPKNEKIQIPALEQVVFSVPPSLSVCQSYELIPQTSQPLEFTLIFPDLSEQTKMANEAFSLLEAGDYKIKGVLPNQTAICPTLREFTVTLVEPVTFEPKLIQEDCFGNRTYQADIFGRDPSKVVYTWYNDANEIVGNGEFLFPTSFGEFKLDVQPVGSESCPIPPKTILIEEPVLTVDLALEYSKLCELGPGSTITLTSDRPDAITDITWRRFDPDGNIENLSQFDNEYEITITEPGIYEAAAFSIIPSIGKDCELGRNSIEIEITPERVAFDIPSELSICETYDLVPSTTQNLVFEISQPDGTVVSMVSGETITLDLQGTYSFFGYNPDFEAPLCPEIKILDVTLYQKISYAPILFQEDCVGEKIYKAEIGATNPADATFTWTNESGNIIGTDQFLTLTSYGLFALDVQPKGSLPCDQTPIQFEVEVPVLDLEVSLVTEPFCPDHSSTALIVETDFDEVSKIEWWYTDVEGNESILQNQTNQKEILAFNEGTYEVRVFNQIPCLLGFDKALILRSTDTFRPEVEENYQVCPKYEIGPTINPGNFSSYEWYFGDQLVSTSSVYKPQSVGDYSLIVFSEEGCAYQTSFTTEEECELKIIYPNAVQPGNPNKEFLLYTNYLIDELDLVILNKWGQVIFQCSETNLISEESTCGWDGTFNGKSIPNGTYAVRINFKNYAQNISKSEFGSILIIE